MLNQAEKEELDDFFLMVAEVREAFGSFNLRDVADHISKNYVKVKPQLVVTHAAGHGFGGAGGRGGTPITSDPSPESSSDVLREIVGNVLNLSDHYHYALMERAFDAMKRERDA